jgi:hypothetical protein
MKEELSVEIPTEWTLEERIAVASALLSIIQSDIYAGNYGKIGRPNITSVLHVLHEAPGTLNEHRSGLVSILSF